MRILKWDGHTHTRYCYHGSGAPEEQYIDRAVQLGFERYTLSEHPPLPQGWVADSDLFRELAMPESELPAYIEYARQMKRLYEGKIEITVGLELDHLPGQHSYTERLVDEWQNTLEDVVYSVHYLPGIGGIRCIDFTSDDFQTGLLAYYGSMETVIEEYYNQVEEAIEWATRLPMRKRLGHINLIEKFRQALPEFDDSLMERRLRGIIPKLSRSGFSIDVNTAGTRVATCGKPYVPEWFLSECLKQGIPCVYGSDAHKPEHVGTGWDWFEAQLSASR
ncbi:Histidinol-phosphatase [Paenibacillus konkukensis]|uniref:Histidinol-phosphatase n=1 Tax=Paenibacillus konkukensis TaxID=2020716 RepID=A0ABY4RR27_9BACL|nr:histidinol-phosphatase HisJ [Paenibacillus konkukensis]UQZ84154.1 Histidinol-phosphatase [Paenibacillus konkukensis]